MAVALLALGLGGCSAGGGKGLGSAGSQAPQASSGAVLAQTKDALALLNRGQADKARKKLLQALKIRPGDMLAQDLLKQIDTDPKVLLGSESYGYTVKDGETMSALAQRFLGDPMKSYALARYNGLPSPAMVKPGDVLQIPGRRRLAPPIAKKAAPAPVKKPPVTVAKPVPAKPAPPAGDAARAAKLRGQGLAAMNAGAINRAVALLRQALSFDPGSALIKRDLARALRIQSTLKGRS
jgi:LysM repeat protein